MTDKPEVLHDFVLVNGIVVEIGGEPPELHIETEDGTIQKLSAPPLIVKQASKHFMKRVKVFVELRAFYIRGVKEA